MTSLNLIGMFYSTRYLGVADCTSSGEEVLEVALTPLSLGVKLENKLKGRSVRLDMVRVYGRFRTYFGIE